MVVAGAKDDVQRPGDIHGNIPADIDTKRRGRPVRDGHGIRVRADGRVIDQGVLPERETVGVPLDVEVRQAAANRAGQPRSRLPPHCAIEADGQFG
jgi:hypothetical protein